MVNEVRPKEDQSLGELFGDLTRDLAALVRQEVALARTEIGDKASHIGRHVGLLAAGGAIAYAGLLAILAAVIITLAEELRMDWWAAALLVGVVVAAFGGFMVWKGLDALRHEDMVPRQTLESLREVTK